MDAADIAHEDIVDEYPDIIVSREVEHHVVSGVRLATGRLHETRRHRQAEVVVDGLAVVVARITGVVCRDAVLDEPIVFLFEHLVCRVEREELTLVRRSAHIVNAPGVIDVEGILVSVVGCVVLGAVIDVVAVLNLEEARHAKMGRLAGLGRRIEQVAEGLAAPGFGKLRIAV